MMTMSMMMIIAYHKDCMFLDTAVERRLGVYTQSL